MNIYNIYYNDDDQLMAQYIPIVKQIFDTQTGIQVSLL
jgi:hypothetical protein